MTKVLIHVVIPVAVVAIFFRLGLQPVYGLGSQTRGALTVWMAMASLFAALLMVHSAFKKKMQGEGLDYWRMTGALILVIPALFQIALAH